MSILVSNYEQINRSLANHSPSKQLYSFKKAKRFQEPQCISKNANYNIKSVFELPKRKKNSFTTFGVSRPILFYSKEQVSKPSPVHYNIPNTFRQNSIDSLHYKTNGSAERLSLIDRK